LLREDQDRYTITAYLILCDLDKSVRRLETSNLKNSLTTGDSRRVACLMIISRRGKYWCLLAGRCGRTSDWDTV